MSELTRRLNYLINHKAKEAAPSRMRLLAVSTIYECPVIQYHYPMTRTRDVRDYTIKNNPQKHISHTDAIKDYKKCKGNHCTTRATNRFSRHIPTHKAKHDFANQEI